MSRSADLAAKIYEEASPSVFVISVRDGKGEALSLGTAFLIAKGTLLTNAHVIEGGSSFLEIGSVRIPATVKNRDLINDLAVLKVGVDVAATPLRLSDKKALPGESIFVIGNPEGLDKSISTGVIAAIRELEGRKLIQITAPVSHGSSGGPVLNSTGEVIGITVAILREGQNLNFAVPAEKVRELMATNPSAAMDLPSLFQRIERLQAAEDKETYSADPASGWQTNFREIDALLRTALDIAGNNPDALVKVAEEARNKDAEVRMIAAQRATDLKGSVRSNFLLAEGWRNKAFFAQDPDKKDFLERAERCFRTALHLATSPTSEMYYGLADVLEDRGSMPEAEAQFRRALALSKRADEAEVTANSLRGLIRTSYSLKKFDETESWFLSLVGSGAATAYDWESQAERLYARAKYKEAGAAYRDSAKLGGNWVNWCQAGSSFEVEGVDEDALSAARECINAGTGKEKSESALAVAHTIPLTF